MEDTRDLSVGQVDLEIGGHNTLYGEKSTE